MGVSDVPSQFSESKGQKKKKAHKLMLHLYVLLPAVALENLGDEEMEAAGGLWGGERHLLIASREAASPGRWWWGEVV